jgi:hypothetical protein
MRLVHPVRQRRGASIAREQALQAPSSRWSLRSPSRSSRSWSRVPFSCKRGSRAPPSRPATAPASASVARGHGGAATSRSPRRSRRTAAMSARLISWYSNRTTASRWSGGKPPPPAERPRPPSCWSTTSERVAPARLRGGVVRGVVHIVSSPLFAQLLQARCRAMATVLRNEARSARNAPAARSTDRKHSWVTSRPWGRSRACGRRTGTPASVPLVEQQERRFVPSGRLQEQLGFRSAIVHSPRAPHRAYSY